MPNTHGPHRLDSRPSLPLIHIARFQPHLITEIAWPRQIEMTPYGRITPIRNRHCARQQPERDMFTNRHGERQITLVSKPPTFSSYRADQINVVLPRGPSLGLLSRPGRRLAGNRVWTNSQWKRSVRAGSILSSAVKTTMTRCV
jgi:hypothetical protein